MINFHRLIQLIGFLLFLCLLILAALSTMSPTPLDLFLLLDPAMIAITAVSARTLAAAFIPALVVLLVTVLFGRVFCGFICPMGTTIDCGDKLLGAGGKKRGDVAAPRSIKYIVLFFLLGASLAGASFVFLAAPLPLVTRFYGLFVYPALALVGNETLNLIQPVAEWFEIDAVALFRITVPRFATQLFILIFFSTLFALARAAPRFWCRFLCPSGALMALASRKPLVRRRVSEDCTNCGKCARTCPMGAISVEEPRATLHEECIVCLTCRGVCPADAVSFSASKADAATEPRGFPLTRRQFVLSGSMGAAAAAASLTGLNSLHGKPGAGMVEPPGLVRPPGARPETDLLARCVRCGECMVACPTNTLQPIWLQGGFPALFSPAIVPRRGYCSPECRMCGAVCPTGAIRELSRNERIWAKTGTAVIYRRKCLAWEHQKSCMVCDEVCPYKAVEFGKEPGNRVPVPRVREDRCAGCGYCEHFCPVRNRSAIVVTPMGALRIADGSYMALGKSQGLTLSIDAKAESGYPPGGDDRDEGFAPGFDAPGFDAESPPGFEKDASKSSAPGFDAEP